MNDKQQLAAMGDELRLTEEQAKGLAERMPKTGVLQILDEEPLRMAKRIEELQAQHDQVKSRLKAAQDILLGMLGYVDGPKWQALIDEHKAHEFLGRIEILLAGKPPVVSITLPASFKGHAVTLDELTDMLNQTGVLWHFTASPNPDTTK